MKTDKAESKTIELGREIGDYWIRLSWDPTEDGRIIWVNFELFSIGAMSESAPGSRVYNVPEFEKPGGNGMDLTESLDEAQPEADGFVKWDGCTQWSTPAGDVMHVDRKVSLEAFCAALLEARRQAALLMGGSYDEKDEYP